MKSGKFSIFDKQSCASCCFVRLVMLGSYFFEISSLYFCTVPSS